MAEERLADQRVGARNWKCPPQTQREVLVTALKEVR